ncbi:hybrid sensor histidine kinase/response regulator [Vibrio tapetis]|uniref:histidine kinase n=1 Tax=Vibrio tapetis subsp. tapetis TaxID=1671868 RepID=A0A2N8ZAN2_9VIBR|nr:hybrid sensor histidine kinase/response regulator [Vibrio tapetis]SON48984.1 putative TWO-COMPONENT SENSOR PROTEIN HISTIDINE PROTEIN KINASE [Vibrio tapetis subsp. tapetis]
MNIQSSLKKKSIIALGVYLCFFITVIGSITYITVEQPTRSKLEDNLDLRTDLLASNVEATLESSLGLLHSITAITEVTESTDDLKRLLPQVILNSDNVIVSGGIWPIPYSVDPNVRLSSLFYNKTPNGGIDRIDLWNNPESPGYDTEGWYQGAVEQPRMTVHWSGVYIDPYTHVKMITASAPYFLKGEFAGVATLDISLAQLIDMVQEHANTYDLGLLLKDADGLAIHEHNFQLNEDIYISSSTFGPYQWRIDVVNAHRRVAEEAFNFVKNLELVLAPLLLLCVMVGYYLINRYLIRPIVIIADKVSRSDSGEVIEFNYRSQDEIRHLIDCFNQKTQYLEEEKVRAQASTKAKTAFLATLSHEIRTPMNGVLGSAQILLKTELNDQQSKLLNSLYDSGEHMMVLLNEILDFSKIEQGQLDLVSHPFAIRTIIGSIESVYHTIATEKGLNFKIHSTLPADRWYNADKARIRQILFNLLNNAIKFTSHGFVEIYLKEVQIEGKDYLSITVRDTGVGIAEEAQQRIFKPFEQAESTTTRKFGGTGLGLAIVKRIANGMNGDITVQSEEGIGSSFTVNVEVEISSAFIKTRMPERTVDCSGLTVLIVEDNRTNTMIMDAFMRGKGFETTSVTDGVQALNVLEHTEFDMILMDNHMPVMDGVEATKRIRKLTNKNASTLILGCTADVFKETREKMLNSGVDDIIAKPIDETELDDTLMKHAHRLQSGRQEETHSSHSPATQTAEELLVELYIALDNQSFKDAIQALDKMRHCYDATKDGHIFEVIKRIEASLAQEGMPTSEDLDYLTMNTPD